MNPVRRYTGYWLHPFSLFNLAVCRIVVVGYQLVHMFVFNYSDGLLSASQKPDFLYRPILAVRLLDGVLGLGNRPPLDVLTVVLNIALVAGLFALVGLLTNWSLMAFALGNILMQGYMYSFGEWHHPDALLIIMLVLLAASPSGRILSLDTVVERIWRKNPAKVWLQWVGQESQFANWPILLMQWLLSLAYLSAGLHKARYGLDWVNGYTLQYWMLSDAIRQGIGLGLWLGRLNLVVQAMSVGALLFELTFWLVLVRRRLALVYVPAGMAVHLGIFLTMGAPFFQYIALYAVFVPWSAVVQALARRLVLLRPFGFITQQQRDPVGATRIGKPAP
jgi:hypothetical protein